MAGNRAVGGASGSNGSPYTDSGAADGGGIYNVGATLALAGTNVDGNAALGGAGGGGGTGGGVVGGAAAGGGIYDTPGQSSSYDFTTGIVTYTTIPGVVTITGGEVSGNLAQGGAGGAGGAGTGGSGGSGSSIGQLSSSGSFSSSASPPRRRRCRRRAAASTCSKAR